MPWPSEIIPPIILDDDVPLPPGIYVAETIIPTGEAHIEVLNYRPNSAYKTWPSIISATPCLEYLRKHEADRWSFKIEPAPTPGRFWIVAFDDWGKPRGAI